MIRNAIVSPHFWHGGPLMRSKNISYLPSSAQHLSRVEAQEPNATAFRKSYVRKVTDFWKVTDVCAAITKEFFENEIRAMFVTRRNSIACPRFGVI